MATWGLGSQSNIPVILMLNRAVRAEQKQNQNPSKTSFPPPLTGFLGIISFPQPVGLQRALPLLESVMGKSENQ